MGTTAILREHFWLVPGQFRLRLIPMLSHPVWNESISGTFHVVGVVIWCLSRWSARVASFKTRHHQTSNRGTPIIDPDHQTYQCRL